MSRFTLAFAFSLRAKILLIGSVRCCVPLVVGFEERNPPLTHISLSVRTTDDYFKNKRVVVFALPGAFTPTCSTSHLPGYESSYNEILANGIDEVYCLSVNDPFVMRQWGLHQGLTEDETPGSLGFTKVKLIPDGAAEFTRAMGMSTEWTTERGFGERSWRYSMVVDNGVIEKMFVEEPKIQNSGPDPFDVSDAGT